MHLPVRQSQGGAAFAQVGGRFGGAVALEAAELGAEEEAEGHDDPEDTEDHRTLGRAASAGQSYLRLSTHIEPGDE